MLKFPKPGDRVNVRLFEEPKKNGESSDDFATKLANFEENEGSVKLGIRLISRKKNIKHSMRLQRLKAEEARRIHDLKKTDPEKIDPQIWDPDFVTEEYIFGLYDWAESVLNETLVGLKGFEYEELGEISKIVGSDPEKMLEALERHNWVELAAVRAITVQAPSGGSRFL